MIIAFDNPKHERLVNDFSALSKQYNKVRGVDSASAIIIALNTLNAANTLADIPYSYRPHPLKGAYKGHFAVDVDKIHRMIFRPDQDEKDYSIDNYKTIKKILIIEIFKDYH